MTIQEMLTKFRLFIIWKLGGVDRSKVKRFVREHLQPNGEAVYTVTQDDVSLSNLVIRVPKNGNGIAIAPWVERCSISNVARVADGLDGIDAYWNSTPQIELSHD